MTILRGVNITASSAKCIPGVALNTSGVIHRGQGYNPVQLQGLTLSACQSQRDGKFENSLNFKIFLTLHRSPVSRERRGLGATYLLHERYLPVPTSPVNGMSWACIV